MVRVHPKENLGAGRAMLTRSLVEGQ